MSDLVTISFVATKKQKKLIEQWAQEDERSISYIIRQILEKEIQRRIVESQKREVINK
jgi:hypothetical protein